MRTLHVREINLLRVTVLSKTLSWFFDSKAQAVN